MKNKWFIVKQLQIKKHLCFFLLLSKW